MLAMIKRGCPFDALPHVPRATASLKNGATLEHAQQIAGHASPKTTTLYDRTVGAVTVDAISSVSSSEAGELW